jgi:hypothetical protein
MIFINRKRELAVLNKWWGAKAAGHKSQAVLAVFYGKRRVGKTSLCLEFAKNKPHVYFLADKLNMALQLRKLSQQIGAFYEDDYVADYGFEDWEQLFAYIGGKKKKMVLIIDEFPYLVEADPAITSVFQKGWDLYLSKSPVYLILCGSSIGMMEKHVLSYKAPLFGRRTGQILVKPFSFFELYEIFPKLSFEKKMLIYSVAGGTISYLKQFIGSNNIFKTIGEKLLSKEEFLYEEVEFLLKEELREPRNYFSILRSIANGKRKLSEIVNDSGFDTSASTVYLGTLNDLFITEREVTVTEKMPGKSRKGLYRITDNFFNFWFNYVFRYKNYIEEGKSDFVLGKIKASVVDILAKSYEEFARAFVREKIKSDFESVGRWWDNDNEIDLVAINSTGKKILFGEVKWSNKQVGTNIFMELKEKAKKVDWFLKNRKERYVLFSKSGFTRDMIKLAKNEKVMLVHQDRIV